MSHSGMHSSNDRNSSRFKNALRRLSGSGQPDPNREQEGKSRIVTTHIPDCETLEFDILRKSR